jgi:hypothetical protein
VRTAANTAAVQEDARSPKILVGRRSNELQISETSLRQIMKKDIGYPHKVQIVQKLLPTDAHSRLSFAERFLEVAHNDNNFLTNLIMSDEAHFDLDGFTNTHNCRIWATENPMVIHEKPLHPERVTVWCAICSTDVIGPYFFEDEMGKHLRLQMTFTEQ